MVGVAGPSGDTPELRSRSTGLLSSHTDRSCASGRRQIACKPHPRVGSHSMSQPAGRSKGDTQTTVRSPTTRTGRTTTGRSPNGAATRGRSRVFWEWECGRAGEQSYGWRMCSEWSAQRLGLSGVPDERGSETHRPWHRAGQPRHQPAVPSVRTRVDRRADLEQSGFVTGSPGTGSSVTGSSVTRTSVRRAGTPRHRSAPRTRRVPACTRPRRGPCRR